MTDAGGSVAETTDYSPLGVPTTPLSRTPYHFTGEMRDGVGLQTHRARHYAPSLGTWTALERVEHVGIESKRGRTADSTLPESTG